MFGRQLDAFHGSGRSDLGILCAGEASGHGPASQRARVAGRVIGVPAGWRAAICCARGCAGSKSQVAFRLRGGAAVRRPGGAAAPVRFPSACHMGIYARIRERHGAVFHREPAHNCGMRGYAAVTGGGWCRSRAARPELPEGGSGRPGGGHGFRALTARSRSCSCRRGRRRPGAGPACLDQPRPAAMSGPLRRGQRSLPGQARRGVPAAVCHPGNSGDTRRGRGEGAADGGLKNRASAAATGT